METTTTETAPALRFEEETCSRCGGVGKYSYNQMDGDRCYGCGGKGVRLTKRGRVAADHLRALRSRRTDTLKAGDVIRVTRITNGGSPFACWATILSVGHYDNSGGRSLVNGIEQPRRDDLLAIDTSSKYGPCRYMGEAPEATHEVLLSVEERRATFAQAIAYQATLTKTGKPKAAR